MAIGDYHQWWDGIRLNPALPPNHTSPHWVDQPTWVHKATTTFPTSMRFITWPEAIAQAHRVTSTGRVRVWRDRGRMWCVSYEARLVAINGGLSA